MRDCMIRSFPPPGAALWGPAARADLGAQGGQNADGDGGADAAPAAVDGQHSGPPGQADHCEHPRECDSEIHIEIGTHTLSFPALARFKQTELVCIHTRTSRSL